MLLAGLTSLQLGGLPARPPPATLKLPSLLQLTSHVRPPSRTVPNVAQHPQSDILPALAAFPGLTRLELTGTIGAVALAQLPAVAAPCLQELLLPQRMCRVGWNDLASLQVGLVWFMVPRFSAADSVGNATYLYLRRCHVCHR